MRTIEQWNIIKMTNKQLPYPPRPHRDQDSLFGEVSGQWDIAQWLPQWDTSKSPFLLCWLPCSPDHICEYSARLGSSLVDLGAEGHPRQQPHQSNWTLEIFVDILRPVQYRISDTSWQQQRRKTDECGFSTHYNYSVYGVPREIYMYLENHNHNISLAYCICFIRPA